uniref:Rho GTP binding protein RhoG n=1 Tax=Echinococcus granulosus TaxID=6210 RepID=A0A068WCB2_ECHGR|nr:rho GTP binding protein RhoG [Echinococcus granulosus]
MTCPPIKCVLVGDGAVGKTCLLIRKVTGNFPESYIPTVFDNYTVPIEIEGTKYQLSLMDTAGQEGYENLRRHVYPNTSVFILCFSVGLRSSFCNVTDKWVKDIREVCPTTPILLVGCQTDIRANSGMNATLYYEGKKLAKEIGAVKYMECSAFTNDGVHDVFSNAILLGAGDLYNSGTLQHMYRRTILQHISISLNK